MSPTILTTREIGLAIRHQSANAMLIGAIILSIMVPMGASLAKPKFEPFIVKATIDAAVLIGLPSSKAAKKYALQAQKPDFLMTEAYISSEPVSWRKLYFRKLFS